jgi:hypothetical protein
MFHSNFLQPNRDFWYENIPPGNDVMIFKNIVAKKNGENWHFCQKRKLNYSKKFDHNNGFCEKRQVFRPKIAENRRRL